ncbi:glycosyltransferase family 2 protein [Marinobacter sp. SS21]|uniref:glycosyltransferase family 2 protein n=1 Tax=Marinobacter sp. SS21 TaxID=2979460 RepID=UPI002330E13C|nr:glycosyltransferase family 2 protein [Marinobacter sp. SS21]MDC0664159.1 glycosyltransferase family 2 protein [Marinobacter sp. SS21]
MKPRTCVITVNFNNARDTSDCLESLRASNTPVQVIVVDNTPDDPNLVKLMGSFSEVHMIRAPKNLGFGRGNNVGIEWAVRNLDFEFILILNNDAKIRSDTIETLESAMDAHPEAGIATSRILLAEDEAKLWYGGGEVDWRRGAGRVPGMLGPADSPLAMKARHVSFASGCAMMLRKKILCDVRGFDERFFMYEEDLELSLRVQEKGWKIWYEPDAVISHIGQGSQKGRNEFVSRYDSNNPNLTFFVYHGFKNCLLNMNMHAIGLNRFKFFMFFPFFLGVKCTQWIARGRLDAIKSAFNAVRDYRQER